MSPQPNHQDSADALRSAISEGDVETVLNLLDRGADVNARIVVDSELLDAETAPLQYAVSEGQLEIVELLLNRGADVDSHDGGRTPLQLAVYSGQPEIVHALLDSGADIDSDPEVASETPLYLALMDGVEGEVVLALLERGSEFTDEIALFLDDHTPSHFRGWGGDFGLSASKVENILRVLLLSGASSDTDARDESGASPLHRAASRGHTELVIAWLNLDAKIDARDVDYQTPLHKAVEQGHTEAAVELLEHGANPEARDKEGLTPLPLAVLRGDYETTNALLENGANAEFRYKNGITPLHAAATLDDCEIARTMMEDYEADINAIDSDGRTPLHYSMISGRSATARLLIERGADILAEDDFGKTPLDYAFEFEYVDEEAEPDFEDDDE